MCSPKLLAFLVGSVYTLFVIFQFKGDEYIAESCSAFILPLLAMGYFCMVQKRSLFFILFLVLYSISDLMVIFSKSLPGDVDYFLGNSLYILAYLSLLIEISKSLCFKYVLKNYKFSIAVLLALNAYIAYALLKVVNPYLIFGSEYFIEITYNVSMLLILSVALLNYFQKDSRKAFYILIGALCIVFSEVLNVAYLYVSHQNLLNFLTVTIALVGFYFLYEQTKLNYKNTKAGSLYEQKL
ncbi:hypothetical protein [Hyunsoonleella rubra]|uniref:YhhN-like protein n=1 Tax=Hyunsoonleella rubra TaxID=1737062 RepID=A0ABW5TD40_9FLAO